jgi:hypothetical protein
MERRLPKTKTSGKTNTENRMRKKTKLQKMEIPIESFSTSLQGKLFAFSDTHRAYHRITAPAYADIAVFAGDACNEGNREQLADFLEWFAALPAKHRLFVAGNHDLPFKRDLETARTLRQPEKAQVPMSVNTDEDAKFTVFRTWQHSLQWFPPMPGWRRIPNCRNR